MASVSIPTKKHRWYISSSNLVILAYAMAFFPCILMMAKFPSAINFLHFAAVPFVCGVVLLKSRSKDREQIATSKTLLFGLMLLLTIGFASALLNDAGLINVALDFLLLTEPFMLILAIVSIPMSPEKFTVFRRWLLGFAFFNVFFANVASTGFESIDHASNSSRRRIARSSSTFVNSIAKLAERYRPTPTLSNRKARSLPTNKPPSNLSEPHSIAAQKTYLSGVIELDRNPRTAIKLFN